MENKHLITFLLCIGIVMLVGGFWLFFIGYYNVDLVFNMKSVVCDNGMDIDNWQDTYNSNGDTITLNNLYLVGLEQQQGATYLILLGGLLVGLALGFINK